MSISTNGFPVEAGPRPAVILIAVILIAGAFAVFPPSAVRAEGLLARLGYTNVYVRHGDGYAGWPEQGPFDAILVTAAPDHVPEPLLEQLAEGGRMVIPVGPLRAQELVLLTRDASGIQRSRFMDVRFVPMTGEALQH